MLIYQKKIIVDLTFIKDIIIISYSQKKYAQNIQFSQ